MSLMRWTATNIEQVKESIAKIGELKVNTDIKAVEEVFDNGIVKGGMYCFVAPTNTGKTRLLLSIAKTLARQGKYVIYVTTEQSIEQVSTLIGFDSIPTLAIGTSINDFYNGDLDDEYADYICYDYLGAESTDLTKWGELGKLSKRLADYAVKANSIIFTACQAKPDTEIIYKNDPNDIAFGTSKQVAYSTSIVDKLSGAAYFLKPGILINFKNRYGERGHRTSINLDYINCEITQEDNNEQK